MEPNDDGTYTIEITPRRKEQKGKDGEVVPAYQEPKRYTAATIDEAIAKIRAFNGNGETKDGADEMSDFMNPERGKETETEED